MTFSDMTTDELIFLSFWTGMAFFCISVIALQIIREQLFLEILQTRSFALDSSWYTRHEKLH